MVYILHRQFSVFITSLGLAVLAPTSQKRMPQIPDGQSMTMLDMCEKDSFYIDMVGTEWWKWWSSFIKWDHSMEKILLRETFERKTKPSCTKTVLYLNRARCYVKGSMGHLIEKGLQGDFWKSTLLCTKLCNTFLAKNVCWNTIFLWSDAAATICFIARFVRLLFKGGYYSRAVTIWG